MNCSIKIVPISDSQLELTVTFPARTKFDKNKGVQQYIFTDKEALEHVQKSGYEEYELVTTNLMSSNMARYPQMATWIFKKKKVEKVVAPPVKKHYNKGRVKYKEESLPISAHEVVLPELEE